MQSDTLTLGESYQHILLSNGIHEYAFHSTLTQNSIDQLITDLDQLYAETPTEGTVLQLFTISVNIRLIPYAMQRGRELIARYPEPPYTRTAMLYLPNDNVAVSIFASSVRLLRPSNFALDFFKISQREEAIHWVLNRPV